MAGYGGGAGYNGNNGLVVIITEYTGPADSTAPTAPSAFDDGSISAYTSSPMMTWTASTDGGSGVYIYEMAIGTTAGASDVVAWTSVGNVTNYQFTGLTLTPGATYYASIRARDYAGNTSSQTNGNGWTVQSTGSCPATSSIYSTPVATQLITVPSGCTSITAKVWGAAGGGGVGIGAGGAGGYAEGIVTVSSGEQLQVFVGGGGLASGNGATGGLNGGANGGTGGVGTGAGGGGYSALKRAGTAILVAGGGAGAGKELSGGSGGRGGPGGGLNGTVGTNPNSASCTAWTLSGSGGTQASGGSGSAGSGGGSGNGAAGTLGTGGAGGGGGGGSGQGGGGGGGGYYGGGGAGGITNSGCTGGGGGGSGFVAASGVSSSVLTAGSLVTPPNTADPDYISNVGVAGATPTTNGGSGLVVLKTLSTGDADPAAFNFTDQTNVALSAVISSDIVQITGIATAVNIAVTGGGTPQYRVCSTSNCSTEVQTWTSTAGTQIVQNNYYVQVRLTSSASASTQTFATLIVGGVSDTWFVTTGTGGGPDTTPDPFAFTDQTGVATSTTILSNILQITGISTTVTVTVSGTNTPQYRVCLDASCTTELQTWTASSSSVLGNNAYLQLRQNSAAAASTAVSMTVNVGTGSDTWSVTTGAGADTTPDPFNFTDQTGVATSTLITSDIVQILGINTGTNISVSGGGSPQYRVCSTSNCSTEVQTWGSTAGTGIVLNNYYVQVRLTSSASASTMLSATLTVGGTSDIWNVTTTAGGAGCYSPVVTAKGSAANKTVSTTPWVAISNLSLNTGDALLVCSAYGGANLIATWNSVPLNFDTATGVYSLTGVTAGTGDLVVASDGATMPVSILATAVSGMAQSSMRDRAITGVGTSSTPSSGGTPTTLIASELLYGCMTINGPMGDAPGTWSNGFTDGQRIGTTGAGATSNYTATEGYKFVSVTGSYSADKTGITSRGWQASIATYKTGSGGVPNAFTFTDLTNQTLNTLVTSNIVQISGFSGCSADVSVSGAGTPQFRVCTDATCSTNPGWGGAPAQIANNQYLQLRATTANVNGTTTNVIPNIGGAVTDTWSLSTNCTTNPQAFSFTDASAAASTVTSSNIIQLLSGPLCSYPISVSGGGQYRICSDATCSTNPAFTTTAGTIIGGQYMQVRATSPATSCSSATTTLSVGATASDGWILSTYEAVKKVFVTSTTHTGNLGGVTGADSICATRATAGSLPGTFKAWISDSTANTSPTKRFTGTTGCYQYQLKTGDVVANNWADLTDGTIAHAIDITEVGTQLGFNSAVATNVTTAGSRNYNTAQLTCVDYTDATPATNNTGWGETSATTTFWTQRPTGWPCDAGFRIYCFEQ